MIWHMCLSVKCRLFVIPIHSQKTEKTFLTLKTLKVISIKFLLVISMLYTIEWSWELRTWSHKMNLLDILSTSPFYFYTKWIGATNENFHFDRRVWRVKTKIGHFATLFNVRDLVLWPWFILFRTQNLAIFNTDIMEYYFFGKNPWHRQCWPFKAKLVRRTCFLFLF